MTTLSQTLIDDTTLEFHPSTANLGMPELEWALPLGEAVDFPEINDETEVLLPEWTFEVPSFEETIAYYDSLNQLLDGESSSETATTPPPTTPATSSLAGLEDDQYNESDLFGIGQPQKNYLSFDSRSQGISPTLLTIRQADPPPPLKPDVNTCARSASSSTGRRRVLLGFRCDDGSSSDLPKDASGYANPLAIYTLFADKHRRAKTEALDQILAPAEDKSLKDFDAGTITCRMRRKIVDGVWLVGDGTPCGESLRSWDSYRRHILQSHLALHRSENIVNQAEKRKTELLASTFHSIILSTTSSPPPVSQNRRRNHEREASRLGVKRRREIEESMDDPESSDHVEGVPPTKRRKAGNK